jgi:hypothetical protein
MKRRGELSYYESKIKLLNNPNVDTSLLKLGCWDAPFATEGLSDHRTCQYFIKQCRKYYEKKIDRILKEQRVERRGNWLVRLGL